VQDIRAFFSPQGGKKKASCTSNGANGTPSRREEKSKQSKKKPRLSTSPEIKKSRSKGSGKDATKSGAKRVRKLTNVV
jgi:hypothetical protein